MSYTREVIQYFKCIYNWQFFFFKKRLILMFKHFSVFNQFSGALAHHELRPFRFCNSLKLFWCFWLVVRSSPSRGKWPLACQFNCLYLECSLSNIEVAATTMLIKNEFQCRKSKKNILCSYYTQMVWLLYLRMISQRKETLRFDLVTAFILFVNSLGLNTAETVQKVKSKFRKVIKM